MALDPNTTIVTAQNFRYRLQHIHRLLSKRTVETSNECLKLYIRRANERGLYLVREWYDEYVAREITVSDLVDTYINWVETTMREVIVTEWTRGMVKAHEYIYLQNDCHEHLDPSAQVAFVWNSRSGQDIEVMHVQSNLQYKRAYVVFVRDMFRQDMGFVPALFWQNHQTVTESDAEALGVWHKELIINRYLDESWLKKHLIGTEGVNWNLIFDLHLVGSMAVSNSKVRTVWSDALKSAMRGYYTSATQRAEQYIQIREEGRRQEEEEARRREEYRRQEEEVRRREEERRQEEEEEEARRREETRRREEEEERRWEEERRQEERRRSIERSSRVREIYESTYSEEDVWGFDEFDSSEEPDMPSTLVNIRRSEAEADVPVNTDRLRSVSKITPVDF